MSVASESSGVVTLKRRGSGGHDGGEAALASSGEQGTGHLSLSHYLSPSLTLLDKD